MADTKVRTTLEIDVDERGIRGLGKEIDRAFSPKVIDAFERSLERTARTLGRLIDQQGKQAKLLDDIERRLSRAPGGAGGGPGGQPSPGGGGGGGAPPGGGGSPREPAGWWSRMSANYVAQRLNQVGHRLGSAAPLQEGFIGQGMSGIPFGIGSMAQASIQAAQQYYQDFVGMMTARAGAFGTSQFSPQQFSQLAGAGVRYGLGPSESAAFAQQLAAGTGLRGDEMSGGLMRRTLDLQHLLGLDVGAAGRIVGAGNIAGGTVGDPERLITEAVATGMEMGVRNSRLDAFLEQVASFTEEARTRGINLSPERALSFARAVGGQGGAFAGEAGTRAAMGLMTAVQGAGDRSTAFGMLAFQAAGYGRGRNAAQAMMELENNPGAVAQRVIERVRAMGGTPEAQAFALRFGFRELGHDLSMAQAMQLASQGLGQLGTGSASTLDQQLAQSRERAGGVFGAPAAEAGFEFRRAGIGGQVAGAVTDIRSLELSAIRVVLPRAVAAVRAVVNWVAEIIEIIQARGLGAALSHVGGQIIGLPGVSDLMGAAGGLGSAVGQGAANMMGSAVQSLVEAGVLSPSQAQSLLQGGAAAGNILGGAMSAFGIDDDGGAATAPSDPNGPTSMTRVPRRAGRGQDVRVQIEVLDRTQGGIVVAGVG